MADQLPLSSLSEPELERRLIDLGPDLFPATPDLATRVRVRIENEPARSSLTPNRHHAQGAPGNRPIALGEAVAPGIGRRTPFSPGMGPSSPEVGSAGDVGSSRRRLPGVSQIPLAAWLVAAILLILVAGGLALLPAARNAIADRLGLQGVLIRWVEEIPTPKPSQVGAPLALGRRVTLDEAQAAVDFPVLIPAAAGFDSPEEIYLLDSDQGEMVSFVYPAVPGLPESGVTGVGALLTQFQGEADRGLIEKGLPDSDSNASRLEAVSVGGEPGFWISGAPHAFFFVCYDAGECRQERYRLAGDVLLWERDGLTLRLESTLSLNEALAIAESVRARE
jgi:hypothetical protein